MKKLIVMISLFGMSFIFNPEAQKGAAWINADPYDAIFIVQPSLNKVTLTNQSGVHIFTYVDFLKEAGPTIANSIENGEYSIIPKGTKAPGINY